jgi:cytochrome c5
MSSDSSNSLIKTPRQLITVIVLAFTVPVILIILLATFVTGQKVGGAGSDAMSAEAIAERLRPVGTVVLAGAATGPKVLQSGEAVYKLACSACHATGAAGAPKAGDNAAWAPRLKQGYDTLVKHAVEGFKAMPAKGGNPDLDAIEVARAVAFMANQSGAKFKEPEAPAAAPASATARSGQQIVQASCGNCHTNGLNGAPKIGDRAAWTQRAARGVDAATAAAIKGHGGMPARGGMADLTDAELKSAVQYMLNQSTSVPLAASAPTAAKGTTTAVAAPAAAAKPDGAKVYAMGCNACHAAGVAGAPKLGDKAAWAPRSKAGIDALLASVTKGKGAMPPKGGLATAGEADLRAAVEYMVGAAK